MRVTRFDKFLDRNYHAVMCTAQVVLGLLAVQVVLLVSFLLGRLVWG